jgi:hypothetical protein
MLKMLMIYGCTLRAIYAWIFEKTKGSSQIWALVQLVLLPDLSAGYRAAVLNASTKKQGFKSAILAAKLPHR